MKNKTFKTTAVLCVFLLLGGCHYAQNSPRTFEEYDVHGEAAEVPAGIVFDEAIPNEKYIYVQMCGYVVKPGVYEVPEGTRIYEILELAGGALEDGRPEALLLAKEAGDGERVYVPGPEDVQDIAANPDDGLVNINTADEAVLMTLPGIGQARAADIVAYRNKNGGFRSIEEIMNVPGIKEAAFNKIKDKIKIG